MKKLVIFILCISLLFSSAVSAEAKSLKNSQNTYYAKCNIIIYKKASDKTKYYYDTFIKGDKVIVMKKANNDKWYKVKKNNKIGYIKADSKLSKKKVDKGYKTKLNSRNGTVKGPTGKECYYNLRMNRVVKAMRNLGFSSKKYPYWIREDGAKMLGKYVIVAANYKIHKKGSVIDTTLGQGLVCDTGSFIHTYPTAIDIAVSWK